MKHILGTKPPQIRVARHGESACDNESNPNAYQDIMFLQFSNWEKQLVYVCAKHIGKRLSIPSIIVLCMHTSIISDHQSSIIDHLEAFSDSISPSIYLLAIILPPLCHHFIVIFPRLLHCFLHGFCLDVPWLTNWSKPLMS